MPGKTAKVTITEGQQDILQTLANAPTVSSQLRQRATIILLALQKRPNREIAAQVGLSRRRVSTWRRRWADAWDRLIRIECTETQRVYEKGFEPRQGRYRRARGVSPCPYPQHLFSTVGVFWW